MYKQENKFLRNNFNFSDSRKRKKKEEKFLSAKYQVRVGISNRFVYIYFFPFFNIRQGWYNLQYIKGKMHTRRKLIRY